MNAGHVLSGKKIKRSRTRTSSPDRECKRSRLGAENTVRKAKPEHEPHGGSSGPTSVTSKRKGFGDRNDCVKKKKKVTQDVSVDETDNGDGMSNKLRKGRVGQGREHNRETDSDAEDSRLIEELRSGVTSILNGLEPDESSVSAFQTNKKHSSRDSAGGNAETEQRKKKRKKKKRKPPEREERPTKESTSSVVAEATAKEVAASLSKTQRRKLRQKMKRQSRKDSKEALMREEEACQSFSNFTLQERTDEHTPGRDDEPQGLENTDLEGPSTADSVAKKAKNEKRRALSLASSADVRERALARIRAAQFRMLNEELYTTASDEAVQSFESDPQAFQVYHEGFEQQVAKWPVNPVDVIIEALRRMPKSTVIADLGCGEAKIARQLTKNKVHSFDLIALNEHVTVCDISKLPLPSQTVDVAVFCLSLMGTNLNTFVLEANRILKKGGLLKIAEVKSRFWTTHGFAKTMKKFGFDLVHKDESNKMFVLFDFKKVRSTTQHPNLPTLKLLPCLYKKR